jgi:hypothetical protein
LGTIKTSTNVCRRLRRWASFEVRYKVDDLG